MSTPSVEAVRRYFDANVEEWDEFRYRDETYRSRGRLALEWLSSRPPGRVLDIGCGTGWQSVAAARQGHTVISMDISLEMARATRARLQADLPERSPLVVVADATSLPFKPGSFDAIVALGLIGFIPDRAALLQSLHVLLKPGGELIGDVANPQERVLFNRLGDRLDRLIRPIGLLLSGSRPRSTTTDQSPSFYSSNFIKHSLSEFDGLLVEAGFERSACAAAGFGELRVRGRNILPWRVQTTVTGALSRLSNLPVARFLAPRALICVVRAVRTEAGSAPPRGTAPGFLFVGNFRQGTGFAWRTIEKVYGGLSERLRGRGIRPYISYPVIAPEANAGGRHTDRPTSLAFNYETTRTAIGLLRFLQLLRAYQVRALYLTDQSSWSFRYLAYRAAGVRTIIVHDRTSGHRPPRGPLTRLAKRLLHRVPWLSADRMIAVSDFVADRLIEHNGVMPSRVIRVHNGIDLQLFQNPDPQGIQRLLGLAAARRIVFCSGRAQPYKGFQLLIECAAILRADGVEDVDFVYCGDGSGLEDLVSQARTAGLNNFHFLGERPDVPRLLGSATIAVIPSLWAEAFGLTVVEAMAAGVPVIASRTGGIPELVEHDRTGLLVPPGDVQELKVALLRLLGDPALRSRLSEAARARALGYFGVERTVAELGSTVIDELERAAVLSRPGGLESHSSRDRVAAAVIEPSAKQA